MELNKKNVAISITIVPVDPNAYYSTDEDSDSDSEIEQQVEQPSTKEAPMSDETRSEQGTSEVPSTEKATATKPSSSKEDAALEEPSDEPVELIDGLFDFAPFSADEDVLLKGVECNDFDLESYLSDKSNSTRGSVSSSTSSSPGTNASTSPSSPGTSAPSTSLSQGTSAPSTSSSQGTSAASPSSSPETTASVQKMQPSISKGTATVDNFRYGMGLTSFSSCSSGTISVPSTSSSRFSASSSSSSPGTNASTSPSSPGTSAPSTSSSQGTSAASTSSSPETTASVQKMQPSISKGTATVDNFRYGMGLTSFSSCSSGTSVPSTSSSRFSASSSSSSPGTSASSTSPLPGTTASIEKIQSSSSKDTTTMDSVRFGIGRGKDIRNLLKCYNRKLSPDDQKLLRKSSEKNRIAHFETELKVSVKEVKKGEMKPAIVRPKNQKEANTIPANESANESNLSIIKQKYVEAVTKYRKKKSQSPGGSDEPMVDKIGKHKQKTQTPKENKETIDEQAERQKEKSQSHKENKDPVYEQSEKRKQKSTESKNSIGGKIRKENLQDSATMDEFTKAILASMEVVEKKPNLEKRKNSEKRRTTLFDDHSTKFQQYLSDKKAKFKRTSSPSLLTHNSRNSTLKCGPMPMEIVKNKFLKTESQRKEDIRPENCASINNANVKEVMLQINTLGQNCSPNVNDVELMKTSLKQENNTESSTIAPTSVRKISVQEYLNRKRPHQSTVSGLDSDADSKNVNKKRITLAEYNQRRVMA